MSVLAIYGASGTGKTHLARGLVQSWQERGHAYGKNTDCAEYLTAADFHHTLADAIKTDTVSEFRRRLRGRRLLAIDDVDRLPRDEYIQQELRYTIDACEEHGAMVVVTSATPVSAVRNLAADVRSRLAGGLELRLAPPDEAARQRLAHHVSAALGRPLVRRSRPPSGRGHHRHRGRHLRGPVRTQRRTFEAHRQRRPGRGTLFGQPRRPPARDPRHPCVPSPNTTAYRKKCSKAAPAASRPFPLARWWFTSLGNSPA